MIFPLVHLGGTSGADLLEGLEAANNATHAALEALSATVPNGRDYYPLGDGALRTALLAHDARLEKLREVLLEIATIHEDVQRQIDEKAKR